MAGPRQIKKRKIFSNEPDKQNVDKIREKKKKRRMFKPYGLGGRGPL